MKSSPAPSCPAFPPHTGGDRTCGFSVSSRSFFVQLQVSTASVSCVSPAFPHAVACGPHSSEAGFSPLTMAEILLSPQSFLGHTFISTRLGTFVHELSISSVFLSRLLIDMCGAQSLSPRPSPRRMTTHKSSPSFSFFLSRRMRRCVRHLTTELAVQLPGLLSRTVLSAREVLSLGTLQCVETVSWLLQPSMCRGRAG